MLLRITSLLAVLLVAFAQRMEWDATNFPNPTAGDFRKCNMRTTGNICDPDEVLSEQQRYRLNHELHQLESRTRQVGFQILRQTLQYIRLTALSTMYLLFRPVVSSFVFYFVWKRVFATKFRSYF